MIEFLTEVFEYLKRGEEIYPSSRKLEDERTFAATDLQTKWRGYKQQNKFQQLRAAAIRAQKYRRKLVKQRDPLESPEDEIQVGDSDTPAQVGVEAAAAVRVQAAWRGVLGRRATSD